MAKPADFIVVPDGSTAGAIVWWELSGAIDLDDMCSVLEISGFPNEWFPPPPPRLAYILRALKSCVRNKRELIRPLAHPGQWELVSERVVTAPDNAVKLEYEPLFRLMVEDDAIRVTPFSADGAAACAHLNPERFKFYSRTLDVREISLWLIMCAERMDCVSLRQKGGFYFIPEPRLKLWHLLRDAVRNASDCRMYEMPAMRTSEAVESILNGLREEAIWRMAQFEDWLVNGSITTRGINVRLRDLDLLSAKIGRYASLLGVTLPDLTSKHDAVKGALIALQLSRASEDK